MTTILNKERILEQARIYVESGKYDKAIVEYEKILSADPSDMRVKLRIAELYTKRKQINEAIKLYREVAEIYAAEEFYLKAVTVLKNILRLNPTLIDVNLMLAELYEKMGLTHDAIRQYDILSTTFDQKGDFKRALDVCRKIVELMPNSESARIKLAEMLQREGLIDEAIDEYEAIAKIFETNKKIDARLAEIYEKILVRRENLDMVKALCKIYDTLGEKKKILKCIESIKSVAETDSELLALQAKVYAALNQLETSKTKFFALADLELEKENIEGALNAYAEVLLFMPQEEDRIFNKIKNIGDGIVDELKHVVDAKKKEKEEQAEIEIKKEKQRTKEREKQEELENKKKDIGLKEKGYIPKEVKKDKTKEVSMSSVVDIGGAEASFQLGKAYLRMGLKEEAVHEFERAKDQLQKIVDQKKPGNDKAEPILDEIDKLLCSDIEKKPAKVDDKPVEVKFKDDKKDVPKKIDTTKTDKNFKNKKKISFV